jgi:hypothetical protein
MLVQWPGCEANSHYGLEREESEQSQGHFLIGMTSSRPSTMGANTTLPENFPFHLVKANVITRVWALATHHRHLYIAFWLSLEITQVV